MKNVGLGFLCDSGVQWYIRRIYFDQLNWAFAFISPFIFFSFGPRILPGMQVPGPWHSRAYL